MTTKHQGTRLYRIYAQSNHLRYAQGKETTKDENYCEWSGMPPQITHAHGKIKHFFTHPSLTA